MANAPCTHSWFQPDARYTNEFCKNCGIEKWQPNTGKYPPDPICPNAAPEQPLDESICDKCGAVVGTGKQKEHETWHQLTMDHFRMLMGAWPVPEVSGTGYASGSYNQTYMWPKKRID